VRLGISSYTYVWGVGVPGFPQPARPLTSAGLLGTAMRLGVNVVQIADNLPLHVLSEGGIGVLWGLACPSDVAIEVGTCGIDPGNLTTYLELARRLRSPILRVVIDTDAHQPSPDEVVATLRELLPQFERADVCLAIENHDRFPAAVLAEIIEQVGSRHIGICLDTANSLGCGEDVHTVLRTLGPHVVNLHIKDFRVERLPHTKGFTVVGCPAGQGVLDIPRLLADLRDLRRDPNVILELWPPPEATIEETIAKEEAWARESIRYLRQFVTE